MCIQASLKCQTHTDPSSPYHPAQPAEQNKNTSEPQPQQHRHGTINRVQEDGSQAHDSTYERVDDLILDY